MDMELGTFGDERLEKRGVICWSGWCRARACACDGWLRGNVGISLASAGSWGTGG